MKIYDRYGRDIFYSTGYNTPWDGKYKGNSVPVDTYYYILDLKNGSPVLSGFVTIIK
jgi:gliding motility-associated-like protein